MINLLLYFFVKNTNNNVIGIATSIAPAANKVKLLLFIPDIHSNNPTANVFFSALLSS